MGAPGAQFLTEDALSILQDQLYNIMKTNKLIGHVPPIFPLIWCVYLILYHLTHPLGVYE